MKLFLLLMILAAPPVEEPDPLPVDLVESGTVSNIAAVTAGPQDLVFIDSDMYTVNLYLDTCTWDAPDSYSPKTARALVIDVLNTHFVFPNRNNNATLFLTEKAARSLKYWEFANCGDIHSVLARRNRRKVRE